MVLSNNISPGMVLSIGGTLYKVESSIKVTVPKGAPFIKTRLKSLETNGTLEKSFKLEQSVKDVTPAERRLEFLYNEGKNYLFLDIGNLEQVLVPSAIVGEKLNYLREGVEVKALFYGDVIFSLELPQFLELMVAKIEEEQSRTEESTHVAVLETGAHIEVPSFIDVGDIIKVDTVSEEYVQRV